MELLRRERERIVRSSNERASMAECGVLSMNGHVQMLQMILGFLHQSFGAVRHGPT